MIHQDKGLGCWLLKTVQVSYAGLKKLGFVEKVFKIGIFQVFIKKNKKFGL